MITPRQEALWVLRAQCNDREALESLLRSVQPSLHGYLRRIVILHFQEELPLADVAAILEIPLGTVKSRLAYGLAILRRQLNDTRSL